MKKSFKLLILFVCILMIGTPFTGCDKKYSDEINFFNYGENIDNETVKEFEEKYNINVNIETFDDMEAMYQKVKSGSVDYDVILVSDSIMTRMINEKLIQQINKDNIPNISQMDDEYLDLDEPFKLINLSISDVDHGSNETTKVRARVNYKNVEMDVEGIGNGPIDSLGKALYNSNLINISIIDYKEHALSKGSEAEAAAYEYIESRW